MNAFQFHLTLSIALLSFSQTTFRTMIAKPHNRGTMAPQMPNSPQKTKAPNTPVANKISKGPRGTPLHMET